MSEAGAVASPAIIATSAVRWGYRHRRACAARPDLRRFLAGLVMRAET